MEYDYTEKKIVAVLASNLDIGVATNVVGHLCISIGAYGDNLMARKVYLDKSGIKHLGISKYPLIVTKVKPNRLKRLMADIKKHEELVVADYPKEMLHTGHDNELSEALEKKENIELEFLGVVIYGDANIITELTGKFSLWK